MAAAFSRDRTDVRIALLGLLEDTGSNDVYLLTLDRQNGVNWDLINTFVIDLIHGRLSGLN